MPKGFAKRNTPAKPPLFWPWIVTGIAAGLLILGLMYLRKQHRPTATAAQKAPVQQSKTSKAPRFDFYTLLPNMKVAPIPKNQGHATPGGVTENTATTNPQHFIIQVAAFRRFSDADGLKATLILSGFSARIKTVRNIRGTWYRVMVGPFTSNQAALKARKRLASADMSGIILPVN